ncbi:MAG: GNAT family N-acetyltransferase [Aestuariibacter sp.]|nr:GNAT family N-acetyltransferase [Marisediminitalea aggregata]MCP3862779.1 GNAT family N-acetyltransferase [Aestuariibacter sp.]MCP4528837.1 GNAT family N-acetyltransferase [Aestuariibacter sp.]MCP4948738.1 GNAT family N-acetyltransferase [Aestuariibacter sp.]MCP9478970.1 GNAT family N-acetyltransferase [Marisediminitalea aggregata]
MDFDAIHAFIGQTYWAKGIPVETMQTALENSVCVGVMQGDKQVAFARVITDKATFGYLSDVFVLPEYRGLGLSKRMLETIMTMPELQGLRRFMLATKDAHSLYRQFGFESVSDATPLMQIHRPDIYQ